MRIKKRSSWDSGSGWVPTWSSGFWVAITKKGVGSGRVCPSVLTCFSSMASSSALWVLGLARLISSASSTWENIGPGWKTKASFARSYTDTPDKSLGIKSEVNCTRENCRPKVRAKAWAKVVFPTPGTSSISRCPPASRQTMQSWIWPGLPTITVLSWLRIFSSVSGASIA